MWGWGGVRDPRIRGIYRAPGAETHNTEAEKQDRRTGRVFAAPSRLRPHKLDPEFLHPAQILG